MQPVVQSVCPGGVAQGIQMVVVPAVPPGVQCLSKQQIAPRDEHHRQTITCYSAARVLHLVVVIVAT